MRNTTIAALAITCATFTYCQAQTSLLELPVKEYKVGFGDLWIGKNVDHRKVFLQGKEIEDYLFAHAPSKVVFDIPPGMTSFSAWGVRTQGDDNVFGSWV